MIPAYPQIERIHRAAMDTDSWSDLEGRAFDRKDPLLDGRKFRSDKELFTLTIAGAHTLITGERRLNKACPIDFPGTSVEEDGITYHIHGISHDKTHERVVHEHLSRLENAIIESDLSIYYPSRAIDHPRGHELKYVSLLDLGLMVCRLDVWTSQLRDILSFRPQQKSVDDVFAYRCIDMRLDDGSTKGYDISCVTLPDHLEHAWLEHHLSRGFDRACLLRSLTQAEYAQRMARRMDVGDMHLIVGLGHERQITYFLEHPDRAEELRLRYTANELTRAARRSRSTTALMAACTLANIDHLVDRSGHFLAHIDDWSHGGNYSFAAAALVAGLGTAVISRLCRHLFTNKTYLRSFLPSIR